ncbi:MAG: Fe(3+) ABC transporter substrate-binding protein [Mariprofundaceae bacterium]
MAKQIINWLILVALSAVSFPAMAEEDVVNVYSSRKEALIKPLLDEFSHATGITVNLITGKADALIQRLKSEGRNSPADLLLTSDVGRLHRAVLAGVLQPVASAMLDAAIPASYRDPEGFWYGLTIRARPIMYARDRVDPAELSTYEALSDTKWNRRICIRSSDNIYNQSLVASMIASQGQEKTMAWLEGFVANFAVPPRGGDRDQIMAAAVGMCDIAIANTYYLGVMMHDRDQRQREAAGKVAIFWPNQDDRGTHVNVSAIALTRAARHTSAAIRLMEFMLSDASQAWYAQSNHEYPVKKGVKASATLRAWGNFKADDINLSLLGKNNSNAIRLMDRAGWK